MLCTTYCEKLYQKGFVNTETPIDNLNPIREAYAKSLVSQLLNVDTTKEAFSVSICGKWGSGKTTFLHNLRNAIGVLIMWNLIHGIAKRPIRL